MDNDKNKDEEMGQVILDLQIDREQIQLQLEQMPEQRLDHVIRNGLEQGRKRTKAVRRRKISIQLLASALCVLLLLTAFVRQSPAFAAMLRDIPGFSGFVELIEGDKTLWNAMNNEFIQPINRSDSKNGFTLTVNGIIADEQRVVILYTGEGPGITNESYIKNYKLTDENGESVEAMIGSSYPINEYGKESILYDKIDIVMGEGNPVPRIIQFSAQLGEEWLEVEVPIDHSRFEELSEKITVDQTFQVGGQSFTLKEAVISPLQVSLKLESDPANTMRANTFIALALVDEKGRRWESKGGFGAPSDKEWGSHFHSSYFEKPKKLTLVADGLMLSEKGKTFVVNTDTGETLRTPDNRITLKDVQQTGKNIKLTVELLNLDKIEGTYGYWFFDHKATFRDADGKTNQLVDGDGTVSSWRYTETGSTAEIYYTIPKGDYKQPLTFDVFRYPGYVLEPINVIIK